MYLVKAITKTRQNWHAFLDNWVNVTYTLVTITATGGVLFATSRILLYAEQRSGAVIHDPVLNLFAPIDLTLPIFIFLWLVVVTGVLRLTLQPKLLLLLLHGYIYMLLLRMTAIYALPLEAPPLTIPLASPIVQIATGGKVMTKDLFFSGHTATMFLLYITANHKIFGRIFLAATVFMGAAVMLQHVHYTIDVVAAPFFAYGCYRFAGFISTRITRAADRARMKQKLANYGKFDQA